MQRFIIADFIDKKFRRFSEQKFLLRNFTNFQRFMQHYSVYLYLVIH